MVGDNLWAHSNTFASIPYMDDARSRVLTSAESANGRLSILAHHSDQLKGFQSNLACTSSIYINVGLDAIDGANDDKGMDIFVGDDLILSSIAPSFTASEGVSGVLDTYHVLRDIEWATMYLDNALYRAQQSLVLSLFPYVMTTINPPCDYWKVRIGHDSISQTTSAGSIIAANYLVLSSSTAHPYGITSNLLCCMEIVS
jgi:hypothetical protein